MRPQETIARFDRFLAARGLRFEGVVVGGTALALLGVVSRQTRDCDVMHPRLPAEIRQAARAFAAREQERGADLQSDWFNDAPTELARLLPQGWEQRLRTIFHGEALTLHTLGRSDLLKAKLFALCDRGLDLQDCLALTPSAEELAVAREWLHHQDAHPGWPAHVDHVLADLARRLGHGV